MHWTSFTTPRMDNTKRTTNAHVTSCSQDDDDDEIVAFHYSNSFVLVLTGSHSINTISSKDI